MRKLKKLILVCAVTLTAQQVFAQSMDEYNNVEINSVNREEAHVITLPEEKYQQSLNGTWKFNWVKDPDSRPTTFFQTGFDDSVWDDITVPMPWQVYAVRNDKNWDKPLYINTRYPFTYDNNYRVQVTPNESYTYNSNMRNPVGSYRRTFNVPVEWEGRDVFVRFNGAGHGYYVWVNGQYIGYAEDSYLPSEFKLSNLNFGGENTIAVQVYRFTSGSFLECQDYWRLTGITRDVVLWSAPKTRIHDYFFRTTELKSDNTEADATITIDLNQVANGYKAYVRILDGATEKATGSITYQNDITSGDINFNARDIETWSAEQPKLYDMEVTLVDNNNQEVDKRTQKIGFRTVGTGSQGELLINGKPIIIHGVNRHDFSEYGGRTITKEEVEEEIKLMKRLNINAVRTSHYPDNSYFYDLCNEYGLYVLSEADVECHGNMGLSGNPLFRSAMVERNDRMVRWLRNYTDIIIWSYGNESGNGNNFSYVSAAIKSLDQTRLTHYEGNSDYADVTSTMYKGYEDIENRGKENLNKTNPKTHIQCENTHAMGQSMGNQREMFDLYEKYPSMAGEFIWDWKDQGLRMDATQTGDNNPYNYYWAYGGDFGDYPNDDNFCCNGLVLPDLSLTGKSYNVKKIYQPVDFFEKEGAPGHFLLKNKLNQIPLSGLDITYDILADGIVQHTGTVNYGGSIAVGESREIDLSTVVNAIDKSSKPGAEWNIRFHARLQNATKWAEAEYEVANEQFELGSTAKPAYATTSTTPLTVNSNNGAITVNGSGFSVTFSNGNLSSYIIGEKELLTQPLRLNMFRIPTDNDEKGGKGRTWDNSNLRNLMLTPGELDYTVSEDEHNVTVSATNTYKSNDNTFTVQMQYTVSNEGVITVNSYTVIANKGSIIPCIGFRLEMAEGYDNMTWLGRGPWDNYPDRKESALVGLYKSKVDEQFSRFVRPQDCGNHEDTRWLAMRNNSGQGLLFVAHDLMSSSTMNYRPEEVHKSVNDRDRHFSEVDFIQENVVCLNAATRGLGNASCGPEVREKYELRAQNTVFNFTIMPLVSELDDESLAEKARISSDITPDFEPVSKAKWSVVSTDNWQPGNDPVNVIDNNPNTFWHTSWNGSDFPHEIIVDLGDTYSISSFIYQGRPAGNDNGRVKNYEIAFSNNPKVFGEPASKGTLAQTAEEQNIGLDTPVKARYMRFTALNQHDDTNGKFTSVAELGIMGKKTQEIDAPQPTISGDVTYYLRETTSGRYLHYLRNSSNNYEGDFCLGEENIPEEDLSYQFTFIPAVGFSTYFNVLNSEAYYVGGNAGWRFVAVNEKINGADGWINVEQQEDATIKLSAVWLATNHKYGNFDTFNLNSYIYADKNDGATFQAVPVEDIETAIRNIDADTRHTPYYNINGQHVKSNARGIVIHRNKKIVNP